jgi:hypothetical protein
MAPMNIKLTNLNSSSVQSLIFKLYFNEIASSRNDHFWLCHFVCSDYSAGIAQKTENLPHEGSISSSVK